MKQNGVVFQAGPSLFFFTFPLEYLISGPNFEKRATVF